MNDRVGIDVLASGVNRADLLQLAGDYSPPPGESSVPGLECAGIVADGASTRFPRGTRVAALLGSGGYDRTVTIDDSLLLPAEGVDPVDAAVLPEALCTIWWNLVHLGRCRSGERVLLPAANSGVGHLAIQAARTLGLIPYALTRGLRWRDELLQMGAETVIDLNAADAFDQLAAASPEGFDLALDLIGGDFAERALPLLAKGGRWLSLGLLAGSEVALDLRTFIRKRIWLTGSSLRSLAIEEKRRTVAGVAENLWPAVMRGEIRARVSAAFPVERAREAHELLTGGGLLGKIVLTHER